MGEGAGKVKTSARFAIYRILRLIISEYQQILYVEFGKWRYSAIIIPAFDEIDDVDDIDAPRTQDLRARVRSWQEAPFPHKYPPGPRAPSGGGSSASSISSVRRGPLPGKPFPEPRPLGERTKRRKVKRSRLRRQRSMRRDPFVVSSWHPFVGRAARRSGPTAGRASCAATERRMSNRGCCRRIYGI